MSEEVSEFEQRDVRVNGERFHRHYGESRVTRHHNYVLSLHSCRGESEPDQLEILQEQGI